jgi:hypothetical protein
MRTTLLAATVLAVCDISFTARADGLIAKLPQDGTWATYKSEGYKERGNKTREDVTGMLKIASVGTTTESGQPCRWIEIEHSYRTDNGDKRQTEKLLIPEKYLTQGEVPAKHIVRGWSQFDPLPEEGKPHALDSLNGKPHARVASFFLLGPAADAVELAPIVVRCKLGEPLCAGRKGSYRMTLKNGDRIGEVNGTFEQRLHDDAPFGVVSFEQTVVAPDGRESMMKFVLDDFGTAATSRLPNDQ